MRKIVLTPLIIVVMLLKANFSFAQNQKTDSAQAVKYSYAYISVQGKSFSKKLKVQVDFGDTPEQLSEGIIYSEYLTNKKSYAAVLNYMVEKQFELVNTLDLNESFQGSGGTAGIVFLMKKRE